jgi:hypothetical protein
VVKILKHRPLTEDQIKELRELWEKSFTGLMSGTKLEQSTLQLANAGGVVAPSDRHKGE